ncbi:hypothetical protein CB1_001533066, partial [Camelus ferus]
MGLLFNANDFSLKGSLQVRYQLSKEKPHVFTIDTENFADRRLHHLKISREGRGLTIQTPPQDAEVAAGGVHSEQQGVRESPGSGSQEYWVSVSQQLPPKGAAPLGSLEMDQQLRLSYNFSPEVEFRAIRSLTLGKVTDNLGLDSEVAKANTLGFVGCLASVQYNHIAPLKAALRHVTVAPVTVQGTLTESSCASMMDSDVNAVTTVHSSSDLFGKTDEREPLTNAVRSDSAVIGGKPFFVAESRKGICKRFCALEEIILNCSSPGPRTLHDLQD